MVHAVVPIVAIIDRRRITPAGFKRPSRTSFRMISFLQAMEREDELRTIPSWKPHRLTGDRKGTWSLFVTKNWRLTFQIDKDGIEIIDLDDEDYH